MDKTISKKSIKLDKLNLFDKKKLNGNIKKRFKKRFKKQVSKERINKIWKSYVQMVVVPDLLTKGEFQFSGDGGKIEIVKMYRENTKAGKVFEKGTMRSRSGLLKKEVKINQARWNYVYKIRFSPGNKTITKVNFKACQNISLQLCNVLSTTPKDFKFVTK